MRPSPACPPGSWARRAVRNPLDKWTSCSPRWKGPDGCGRAPAPCGRTGPNLPVLPAFPGRGKRRPRRSTERGPLVEKTEMAKVERYLRQTFANHSIRVVARPKKDDSAEV